MLPFVSFFVLVLAVTCGAMPRRPDPDQLLYNEGMLDGDIAGGYIKTTVNVSLFKFAQSNRFHRYNP